MLARAQALVVTQHYAPEPIGSAPFCADLSMSLAAHGAAVSVLTNRPFYPDGEVPEPYRRGARDSEAHDGVRIERVAPWLVSRRGAWGRILADAAFVGRGALALANGRVGRAPLVISFSPSVLCVLLGRLCAEREGRQVVIVHDIESGLASGLGMVRGTGLVRAFRTLERFALERADLIVTPSIQMKRQIEALGVRTPVRVVPLWVDAEAIRPIPPAAGAPKTVLYSGNIGRKQGLEQVLDLAAALRPHRDELRFVIRGKGSERAALERGASARGLDNVSFESLLPPLRLSEGLAQGHVHVVPQNPRAADFAVPSKIFAIMAAGRPFVATARPGSALWDLQRDSGAFLCVAPHDTDAFAEAVLRLARDEGYSAQLGRHGRSYVEERHSREAVTRVLLGCIERLS
jgi:colanic acid biosynthesis glycosyl transferase WcaI